jgi:TonB family protein
MSNMTIDADVLSAGFRRPIVRRSFPTLDCHAMRAMLWIPIAALMSFSLAAWANEVTQPASVVRAVVPIYPSHARRYEIAGTVVLRIRVLADGRVGDVQVQESSGSTQLDAAAVEAAKKSEYGPAQTASGSTVDSWVSAPYRFVIR